MYVPKPKKLPSGNWFIHLRLGGVNYPITESSKDECINQATLIKAKYKAGELQAEKDPQVEEAEGITLGAAMSKYIQSQRGILSPSTIIGYEDIRRNRFKSCMDRRLNELGKEEWQEAIKAEGKSPKTIKNSIGLIKKVYKENGLMFPDVTLPAQVKAKKAWLTPEEIKKFMKLVKGEKCEIPALLALNSLRKSEVCGLEWSDIDLKKRKITIRGAMILDESGQYTKRDQNKTEDSARTVSIRMNQLYDALMAVEDKTGFVVKVHPETPYRQIQKICEDNDLPLVGWHGLRHSFASLCYLRGIPEMTAMRLGGWSDYQTMRKIYTHIAEQNVLEGEDILDEFWNQNANENANERQKQLKTL